MASAAAPTPALPPPPGETPNFGNPDTLREENLATQAICLTFAGLTFLLRSYARLFLNKKNRQWSAEDWSLGLSLIGLGGLAAVAFVATDHGGGAHQWNITIEDFRTILYVFWIGSIIYGPAILFAKSSILLMYARLFRPRKKSFMWWTIWTTFHMNILFYVATLLVKIWQCSPREKIWIKSTPGTCVNLPAQLFSSGLYNLISDIVIVAIPIKTIWTLNLSLKKKVGACLVLALGVVAPVLSAVGFVVRLRVSSSKDVSFSQPQIQLWGSAELTTGILCACLPTMPAIFRAMFGKKGADTRYGSGTVTERTGQEERSGEAFVSKVGASGSTAAIEDELEKGSVSDDDKSQIAYDRYYSRGTGDAGERSITKTVEIQQTHFHN